jgi:beta-1,4-mannosyltransferase
VGNDRSRPVAAPWAHPDEPTPASVHGHEFIRNRFIGARQPGEIGRVRRPGEADGVGRALTADRLSQLAGLDALIAAAKNESAGSSPQDLAAPDPDGQPSHETAYAGPPRHDTREADYQGPPWHEAPYPGPSRHEPAYPVPPRHEPAYQNPPEPEIAYPAADHSDPGYRVPARADGGYEPLAVTTFERTVPPVRPSSDVEDHGGRVAVAPMPAAPNSAGPRQSEHLRGRLARWKPRLLPLLLPWLIAVLVVGWFTEAFSGPLGWPVTLLWTWPIIDTLVGIRGIFRTRRSLKRSRRRWRDTGPTVCEDFLVVVVPSIGRHDTYPALDRSVMSFIRHLPGHFPWMRVDVVIEEGCEAADRIYRLAARSELIRVIVVPKSYRTRHGTRFKARANHYAHELRIYEGEARDDVWVLHMDDDTGVGPDTALAMARFIEEQYQAGAAAKHMAQGILTYPRELAVNRLTWLADAVRPGHDVSRFAAWTGGGTPRAGLHGELLLLRASVEATIGWDFGPRSIVEDAQFALVFCRRYKGKSAWFAGRCYGASPASVRDFIRQRERWNWGLIGLACNRSVPLRNRAYLAYSMVTCVIGPLQNVAVILAAGALLSNDNTSPESLLIIPFWALNLAFAVWMYWEGLRLNAGVSARGRRRWWEPPVTIVLIPFFAMLEGIGGLRGFFKFVRRAENKFVVIAKPT